MKFTIFAPDFKITPAIHSYLEKKTKKLDDYFSPLSKRLRKGKKKDAEIEARIKIEETNIYHRKGKKGKRTSKEGKFKVEIDLSLFGQEIISSVCGSNLYRVIDKAYKKLKREGWEHKFRRHSLLMKGSRSWKNIKNRAFRKRNTKK
jgi:ribosomal subunit interface protein